MRLAAGLAVLLLAGCGSETAIEADPAGAPYDGPMVVELDHRDRASALEASGAAGLALECAGDPRRGGGGAYEDGLETVQDSPQEALGNWREQERAAVPEDGYRVERVEDGRVLLSYDVGEETKAAVVVHDDVTDFDGDTGWGVEAWATCDPAELGVEVAEELGFEVWQDDGGAPVPTTEVVSYAGPEHCDWQDLTFLRIGFATDVDRRFDQYVSGDLGFGMSTDPDPSATLPGDAVDTGWSREGQELWLGDEPRAAYLVDSDDPRQVERWPALDEPAGCM
ncbi:hypothetical protein [Nocardioides caricicola]|uniref:Lipoprotein n=1 Tax=Nocardioides caricicola TaxID=634770 RepID=A0ABW0N399_9ACTN